MGSTLPILALGTVTFPGMAMSLHVFEDRYLGLISQLLSLPEPERVFATVAIREGHEVGSESVKSVHRVGCELRLRRVEEVDDGLDVTAEATRRIRLDTVIDSSSHLWADVTYLPEEDGADAADAATRAHAIFAAYIDLLASAGATIGAVEVPAEPLPMSYALSAGTVLTPRDRQGLL